MAQSSIKNQKKDNIGYLDGNNKSWSLKIDNHSTSDRWRGTQWRAIKKCYLDNSPPLWYARKHNISRTVCLDIFDKGEYLCAGTTGLDRHLENGWPREPQQRGRYRPRQRPRRQWQKPVQKDRRPWRPRHLSRLQSRLWITTMCSYSCSFSPIIPSPLPDMESRRPTVRIGWDTHDSEHITAKHS